MLAYGELNVMEILIDLSEFKNYIEEFRNKLNKVCRNVGQDVILQTESVFSRPKRLIVFDVDGTLIDAEIIDEMAKVAGVDEKVKQITSRAMNGDLDFKEALHERVKLLKGLPIELFNNIAENIEIKPATKELINSLKTLGFKIALISGGFSYFVEKLKEKLEIDYAYANKLVIKNGKLTGEIEKPIIDAKFKAKLIEKIAAKENFLIEEIVAVGDGANDRFMLKNSGLGIALYPKKILQSVADGIITKENLLGILYCLGAPEGKLSETILLNKNANERN
jgi:phosphoserine phosphatase